MHDLKIVEDEGWILTIKDKPLKCVRCFDNLSLPFFFCPEFENGRCNLCEINGKERTCNSLELHHEHFNIIQIKEGG